MFFFPHNRHIHFEYRSLQQIPYLKVARCYVEPSVFSDGVASSDRSAEVSYNVESHLHIFTEKGFLCLQTQLPN